MTRPTEPTMAELRELNTMLANAYQKAERVDPDLAKSIEQDWQLVEKMITHREDRRTRKHAA